MNKVNLRMRTLTSFSCVLLLGGCCFGLEVKEEEGNRIPVLDKCCPEDQVLSQRDLACIEREDVSSSSGPYANLDVLSPPFASQHPSLSYVEAEDYYDYPAANLVPFNMSGKVNYPACDEETENLIDLSSPGNEVAQSDFVIDDQGLTGDDGFPLLDMKEFEAYQSYCVDRLYYGERFMGTAALICATKLEVVCSQRPCVSYCCQQGEVFGPTGCKFPQQEEPHHDLQLYKDVDAFERSTLAAEEVKIMFGLWYSMKCKEGDILHTYDYDDEFLILESGNASRKGRRYARGEYCIEDFEVGVGNETRTNFKVLACAPKDPYSEGALRRAKILNFTIVPILFVVSIVFLSLLFAHTYIKNRHKLFGAMILCLISMLFMFYVTLAILKLSDDLRNNNPGLCVAAGIFCQFVYLSAMFWLNSISFDMWLTFRQMRVSQRRSAVGPGGGPLLQLGWRQKRFKWYALYSWGGPFIISLVTVILQALPEESSKGLITPRLGFARCFIYPDVAMILYQHVYVLLLLCVNGLLFTLSAWNICCGVYAHKGNNCPAMRKHQRQRYVTVMKMFFAMGMTWLAEVVAFAIDWGHAGNAAFGSGNDIVNFCKIIISLQGLIMFCVIVLDSAALSSIKRTFFGGTVEENSPIRRPTQMSQMSNTSSLKKLTSRINGGTRGDVKIATGDTIDEAKELKDDSL